MKPILIFILVLSNAFAKVETVCELTEGIYRNSPNNIRNVKFITITDIFSLNNAKTLSFNLDGEELHFPIRTEFQANKHTRMTFKMKEKGLSRAAHILIDRKPREAYKSREFLGNILITPEMESAENLMLVVQRQDVLTYNFVCRF